MAITQTAEPRTLLKLRTLAWSEIAFGALTMAGALLVVIGSYQTWATFYAGLVERNGVAGDGKYLIALAVVAGLAAISSRAKTLGGLRLLVPAAGAIIGFIALRDLRNLDALIADPSAAFYVPGKGDGLYIILAGASLLVAAFFAAPRWPPLGRDVIAPQIVGLMLISATGALIAGAYGEYYLHLAPGGHLHGHTDPMNTVHVLTFAGASTLVGASSAATYLIGARRRR